VRDENAAAAQVDELKVAPNDERDGGLSALELTQRALDRDGAPLAQRDLPVNDLTSVVVKKKKKAPLPAAPAEASGVAEIAEDEETQTPQDKKAHSEESPAP
jgi:hypothetical protein